MQIDELHIEFDFGRIARGFLHFTFGILQGIYLFVSLKKLFMDLDYEFIHRHDILAVPYSKIAMIDLIIIEELIVP